VKDGIGREISGQYCMRFRLPSKSPGSFYMPQICDIFGVGAESCFTSPPKEGMMWIFSPEKSEGFGRVRNRDLGYQMIAC
jgi:hypothetical protein